MRGADRKETDEETFDRTDRRPAPPAHEYQRAARDGKTAPSRLLAPSTSAPTCAAPKASMAVGFLVSPMAGS
jgi:hypothetical protein